MAPKADIPDKWQLKQIVQRYLATIPYKVGEMIQLGWFIFRVADQSIPPEIESLDFLKLVSFTTDFSAAERIHSLQTAVKNVTVLMHRDAIFVSQPSFQEDTLHFEKTHLSNAKCQQMKTIQDGTLA